MICLLWQPRRIANTACKIEKEAENTPNSGKVEWFLQGTLYPDV